MGPYLFIAMGVTYKVDIHRVDGMCADTLGEVTHQGRLAIEGCGNPSRV